MLGGPAVAGLIPAAPAHAVPQFVPAWGSNGPGDNPLSSPPGVTTHSTGAVYVADQGNSRIQKLTSSLVFVR